MLDKNSLDREIPLSAWEYYFVVYGDMPIVTNGNSGDWLTMEELFQVFAARLLAVPSPDNLVPLVRMKDAGAAANELEAKGSEHD
jgi:hypothetical protein